MRSLDCRRRFAKSSSPFPIPFASSLILATLTAVSPAAAQDEAVIDAVAAILAVEDARRFDEAILADGARHSDRIVRRRVALALGRIGDGRALSILVTLSADPDTVVRADAVFALGQLGDASVLGRLQELVLDAPLETHSVLHAEVVTAVSKIGGPDAASILQQLLSRWGTAQREGAIPPSVLQALREAWRLGENAPRTELARFALSPSTALRATATYSLARLRHPEAFDQLIRAVDDPDPGTRRLAVRALTQSYVDSAGRNPDGVAAIVRRLTSDSVPAVRIAALRALATFSSLDLARAALDRTADVDPNVRVEAVGALAAWRNPESADLLAELADEGPFPMRRQALLSLGRVDPTGARRRVASWMLSAGWQFRAAAAEVLAGDRGDTAVTWLERLLADADGRVVAQAFAALTAAAPDRARELAVRMLDHPDAVARTFAAEAIAQDPRRSDATHVVAAYGTALEDSIPDARLAAVQALGAIARTGVAGRLAVEDELFSRYPRNEDYLVRRIAAHELPSSIARWGSTLPIATGRDIGDYRDIARRFVLPIERGTPPPRLLVETDRGTLAIELFSADAPLTVNALLRLVEQRFFDGQVFHRLVPSFAAQAGDPRGDGWGGPGFTLRDEVSRRRFDAGVVGMALFGPDTGGGQFFITLSAQPHLEGRYPAVGRVVGGGAVLARLVVGDRIRTVRRQ
jgi:cyclophilin family peptidyl-prolyl cis-trans isomerase/HEAT repeat protein